MKTNLERGFHFLFLRCGRIFQALSFPENDEDIGAVDVNCKC